jgi:hypothetical protein
MLENRFKLEDGKSSKNPSNSLKREFAFPGSAIKSWRKRKRESRSYERKNGMIKHHDLTSRRNSGQVTSTGSGQVPSEESDSEEDE